MTRRPDGILNGHHGYLKRAARAPWPAPYIPPRCMDDSPPSPKLLAPVVMALLLLVLLWVGRAVGSP